MVTCRRNGKIYKSSHLFALKVGILGFLWLLWSFNQRSSGFLAFSSMLERAPLQAPAASHPPSAIVEALLCGY